MHFVIKRVDAFLDSWGSIDLFAMFEKIYLMKQWGETPREQADICSANTFVPTIFRHTLIYAACVKLAPLRQSLSQQS